LYIIKYNERCYNYFTILDVLFLKFIDLQKYSSVLPILFALIALDILIRFIRDACTNPLGYNKIFMNFSKDSEIARTTLFIE